MGKLTQPAIAKRLRLYAAKAHEICPDVPLDHGSNHYNTVGLGNITDIIGWNLYQGWYGGELKSSEIAYKVGMNSTGYFRQCFKEEFGLSPSDYLKQIKQS